MQIPVGTPAIGQGLQPSVELGPPDPKAAVEPEFQETIHVRGSRNEAVGDSFTITSDEYLPWNRIYEHFAQAAGALRRRGSWFTLLLTPSQPRYLTSDHRFWETSAIR
jgi:hypothetical protein